MRRFLFWLMMLVGGVALALVIYAFEIPLKVARWFSGG